MIVSGKNDSSKSLYLKALKIKLQYVKQYEIIFTGSKSIDFKLEAKKMADKPNTAPKEVIQITEVEPLESTELSSHEWGKFQGVIKEEEEFLAPHLYY